jgi:hypothetical protein
MINYKILSIAQTLSSDVISGELMLNTCQFIKGSNEKIQENGTTLFLNVAAANGRPNRWIKNTPNIKPGDITLTLDGTTGLVNKSLEGFNGYLQKVVSNKYTSAEIYFSLLKPENQTIIKMNETGTTIKHSPNSKKQLKIYKFKNKEELENIFKQSLLIETYLPKVIKLKEKMIDLLVK